MTLDMLSYQKGVKVPGRNIKNRDYNRVFDETARRIYKAVTGNVCPVSVKVSVDGDDFTISEGDVV